MGREGRGAVGEREEERGGEGRGGKGRGGDGGDTWIPCEIFPSVNDTSASSNPPAIVLHPMNIYSKSK